VRDVLRRREESGFTDVGASASAILDVAVAFLRLLFSATPTVLTV
jgi:hypothetical protein